MLLTHSKLLAIAVLGLGAFVIGLLPLGFTKRGQSQWPLFLSTLLCFGGGVLFSTSLTHMLPEVREQMPEYEKYAEIVFCVGFFILYILDEMVHCVYGGEHAHGTDGQSDHGASTHNGTTRRLSFQQTRHYGATERNPLVKERQPPYNPSFYKARSDSELFFEDRAPSQLCHVTDQEPCQSTLPVSNIGLIFALSVHALLEGLAVGLENKPAKVLLLLGAIASHKLVVGFCLGVELSSNASTTFCKHFISIFIFAFGSVAGIIIGMLISNAPKGLPVIVVPILQGLAGGTLLYVTLSEVIPRERARWHQQHTHKTAGILQFFAVATGFFIMTALNKYLEA